MFFNFPPLKYGDEGKENEVSFLSSRETTDDDGGSTLNIDILRVKTVDDEGNDRVTHFGIQGRSDHLADLCGQGGTSKKQGGDAPAAA